MKPLDIGEMVAIWMVMFGDILTVIALGGSFFFLLGIGLKSRKLAVDGGGAAFLALVIGIYGFAHKIADPGKAEFTNGFTLKFSNGVVGVLLAVAALLWFSGIALIALYRMARVKW